MIWSESDLVVSCILYSCVTRKTLYCWQSKNKADLYGKCLKPVGLSLRLSNSSISESNVTKLLCEIYHLSNLNTKVLFRTSTFFHVAGVETVKPREGLWRKEAHWDGLTGSCSLSFIPVWTHTAVGLQQPAPQNRRVAHRGRDLRSDQHNYWLYRGCSVTQISAGREHNTPQGGGGSLTDGNKKKEMLCELKHWFSSQLHSSDKAKQL